MTQVNLFMMVPTIGRHSKAQSAKKPRARVVFVDRVNHDEFCKESVVDDWIRTDWLAEEYTWEKAGIQRQLDKLNKDSGGW